LVIGDLHHQPIAGGACIVLYVGAPFLASAAEHYEAATWESNVAATPTMGNAQSQITNRKSQITPGWLS
jgi:hypothetical protein